MSRYTDVERGKEEFFANQKVMILVPHEDDDINLMGGIIEQYAKYGSDVYVVFATNGDGDKRFDMSQMGFIRMDEAIKALGVLGVTEENIIFLGYGDGWDNSEHHIYNAEPDEVMKSTSGRTSTYGLRNHQAFCDGKTYTYSNYYDDIKQVILEHLPDVIYCIDYDTHNDHRALSMLFEKVMGDILKTTEYKPTVYKGYGYRTAWNAVSDFSDSVNITATVNNPSDIDVEIYDWNRRVRIPIYVNSVNRSLRQSYLYKVLSVYASQKADKLADKVINGDKVFWIRRTDSVLYDAEISVSSGDKDKLIDFMLLDCDDLMNQGNCPYDGVWHPDDNDYDKLISVSFNKEQYVDSIVLYDNPSPEDNILNAVITLDDGTVIETGALDYHSGANVFSINKEIRAFSIRIESYEGEKYGLVEIEAYASDIQVPTIYKFTDENDNFIYDYIVPVDGKQELKIYSSSNEKIDVRDFLLRCDNTKCKVELCGNEIIAYCKAGQKCQIELLCADGHIFDRAVLRNPHRFERYCLAKSLKHIDSCSYLNRASKYIKSKFRIK
ncbi:MAG: PIG-L family deacetylase [Ruminococcus sp.]|nr:PIG-L family deacetylase [Ruminococcus sp.]